MSTKVEDPNAVKNVFEKLDKNLNDRDLIIDLVNKVDSLKTDFYEFKDELKSQFYDFNQSSENLRRKVSIIEENMTNGFMEIKEKLEEMSSRGFKKEFKEGFKEGFRMKTEFSSEEQAKKSKVEQEQVDRNTEVSSDEIKVEQDQVGRKKKFVSE